MFSEKTLQLFWSKVDKSNDCWEWTRTRDKDGYGIFCFGGENYRAHRYSFMLTTGNLDKKILVLHKCDNPGCVNPSHLFLGTHRDNVLDMIKKGRGNFVGTPKLTKVQAQKIKKMYASGKFFQRELAEMFGVKRRTIGDVVNNISNHKY